MICPHHFVRPRRPGIGLAGSFFAIALSCLAQPKAGDIIFQIDFEGVGALRQWGAEQSQNVRIGPGFESDQALVMERPAGESQTPNVRIRLPVEKMRGCRLSCRAMVKADGVTEPPQLWNGIKFMLHIRAPGGDMWPQQNNVFGTFDWKRVQFKASIPTDATAAELMLGRDWNANLIRWQLIRYGPSARITKAADYETWLEGALRKLDAALPLCGQYGLRVGLDLHSPFGGTPTVSGYVGTDTGLFTNRVAQEIFALDWQRMARRYRDSRVIWGYDLANEPVEGEVAEGCDDWMALASRASRAVRASDTQHAIIVEPTPWGGPEALENVEPISVPGVVYSCTCVYRINSPTKASTTARRAWRIRA